MDLIQLVMEYTNWIYFHFIIHLIIIKITKNVHIWKISLLMSRNNFSDHNYKILKFVVVTTKKILN